MLRTFNVTFRKILADGKSMNPIIGKGYETEKGHIDVIINATPLNWDGKLRLWVNVDSTNNDEVDEEE